MKYRFLLRSIFNYNRCHYQQQHCHHQFTTRCFSCFSQVSSSVHMSSAVNKVCIVGSGNWGSAIAKIVGNNVAKDPTFEKNVSMYVYEEMIEGRKLTDIINTDHENLRYLPGIKLPENVIAIPDVTDACKDADILVFVLPHQFIRGICQAMKGHIKPNAIGISLIKGNEIVKPGTASGDEKGLDIASGGVRLISEVIHDVLDIECNVLMGANLAPEVARENYCEATIGCKSLDTGALLKRLMQASYFRIVVVTDAVTVELCGALKNVVAVGAGVVDGLGYGDNTKAAVIRLGMMEMIAFIEMFFPGANRDTFFESCGVADLVTTCYGGRNSRLAKEMALTNKDITVLEKELLNGQSLQGPPTAAEINIMLKSKGLEDRFPMFTAIHRMCVKELECSKFIDCLKNHPEHISHER
ncbi:glycerol-3-phosphate dehydrogenase [NAD(+)], cytoplasmic-like isoform X2 [Tubulanus polymorphus]|uniref:glycerol-3-phosphate dehydrogenase [NAD(+)], cytoplasmic-like isoform X2 n=1 Tax=Tubulanus polymorphus TaxID=672921 RepID=UPI003DA381FF